MSIDLNKMHYLNILTLLAMLLSTSSCSYIRSSKDIVKFKSKARSINSWEQWKDVFGRPTDSSPKTDNGEIYHYYANPDHTIVYIVKSKNGDITEYDYIEKTSKK